MKTPQERAGNQRDRSHANFPFWRNVITVRDFSIERSLSIIAVEMNANLG
jgi:hypothetical protein